MLSDIQSDNTFLRATILLAAQVLKYLDYHPETHPRVLRDAGRACDAVMLFSSKASSFLEGELGSKYKSSLLLNQEERAKHLPDRRSCRSSSKRDASFFKDFEDVLGDTNGLSEVSGAGDLPMEWDVCMRPKIAHRKQSY